MDFSMFGFQDWNIYEISLGYVVALSQVETRMGLIDAVWLATA